MQLLVAHQVLIGAAIALAALFGVRALWIFSHGGGPLDLGLALGSALVAAILGVYLRSVRAKWRSQRGR